ncbi:putative Soluble pyridine nucleotide transhydrogenase, partial [Globisporangium splendens]
MRQKQRKALAATAHRALSSSAGVAGGKPLSDMLRELKASEHFDLIVIGSGPAGQKCAIDSAKHGKSVAIIDKRDMHGGVCVHTGTVPSKTFREATLHLTAYRHRSFYDGQSSPTKRFGIEDILQRVKKVEHAETDVTRHQLLRNNVELINGTARFLPDASKNMIAVLSNDSYTTATDAKRHASADICKRVLTADKFLIAVGTRPARRPDIPFDGETIFDSDQLLWGGVKTVPKRLIVVGAGVIGMEYASMMSIIPGMEVTIIDGRKEILDMADREVSEALCYSMRQTGARFFVEETIKSAEKVHGEVIVHLNSGKTLVGDGLLYTLGRQGNTDGLNLSAVGLEADKRGLIQVDNNFQTAVPHMYGKVVLYAAGDCIGFPALASTSMEQGRLASVHMRTAKPTNKTGDSESTDPQFMRTRMRSGDVFPFGIYTVPEISMVGKNEQQLTRENVPYEVGLARYEELAKGQMLGGVPGFLKIIFCPKTLQVLGVHAIGEGATEIIHIGQVVMSTGGTIEYFRNAVFNYPTLAEAYRVAALNGLRKVESLRKL